MTFAADGSEEVLHSTSVGNTDRRPDVRMSSRLSFECVLLLPQPPCHSLAESFSFCFLESLGLRASLRGGERGGRRETREEKMQNERGDDFVSIRTVFSIY